MGEAPSRHVVQQLAAPRQLAEEWRVTVGQYAGEHGGAGNVVVMDVGVSYSSSRACGQAIRRQYQGKVEHGTLSPLGSQEGQHRRIAGDLPSSQATIVPSPQNQP